MLTNTYPNKGSLDINQIRAILPQAYPFIFIDRVTQYEKNKQLTAIKQFTANEWPFTGHNARFSWSMKK